MKCLRVGDPHVKPSNLEESNALMYFVLDKAIELKVDRLEILGDLFDTHSVVRLEVQEFWAKWFKELSQQDFKTFVLVGNHDLSGDYSREYSALHPFIALENKKFKIIHEPYYEGFYGYLPYIHNDEKFIYEANNLAKQGVTVLISHPNYKGAVYDNGSSILGGVDPNNINSNIRHLIGGHIHTELELGRIWYTGNPRWLTKNDSNKRKGIWTCIHDDDTGQMISKEFISTGHVCTPIVSLQWKEGQERPEIPSDAKVDIELIGSSDWVSKTKKDLVGISISSKITDIKKSKERKSGKSLSEFLNKYYDTNPERRKKLFKYLEGLNLVE